MKTEFQFKFVPSGRVSSTVRTLAGVQNVDVRWIFKTSHHGKNQRMARLFHLWIAYATELDTAFVKRFREEASSSARLLVFNEGQSSDTVASRLTDLQLRSPHRFYVADLWVCGSYGTGKSECVSMILQRLASVLAAKENPDRVLDAKVENEVLRVVAPDFRRLEVPISKIPSFQGVDRSIIENFEIDTDGAFIHWPKLDTHLGWEQLDQITNPASALKARQRSQSFNVRYGRAIRKVREQTGLGYSDIPEISEKQLRRIEKGECRLTSNAAEALASAHKLTPSQYLDKLAKALD